MGSGCVGLGAHTCLQSCTGFETKRFVSLIFFKRLLVVFKHFYFLFLSTFAVAMLWFEFCSVVYSSFVILMSR